MAGPSMFSVSNIANMTDAEKSKLKNPVTELVYVQVGDVGADYVAGSDGQVKTITEYQNLAKTVTMTVTTLTYRDAAYPTKVTSIEVV